MKALKIDSALVSLTTSKDHDFLYIVKKVHNNKFLPRIQKAVVRDIIKSEGLYHITFKLYKNKAGYDTIYVHTAKKIKTS